MPFGTIVWNKKGYSPCGQCTAHFFWIKAISSFQKRREGSSWICSDCWKIQTSGSPGLLFHLAVHWSLCSYMEYRICWYFVEFTFPICQLHFDKLQSPHWYVWTSNLRADSETFEHSENKLKCLAFKFHCFLIHFCEWCGFEAILVGWKSIHSQKSWNLKMK